MEPTINYKNLDYEIETYQIPGVGLLWRNDQL